MPIPAAAQTRINTFLTNVANVAATKQSAYYAGQEIVSPSYVDQQGVTVPAVTRQRQRYWQGVRVLSSTPADGATGSPDLTRKPHYQPESWADLNLNLPANLEVQLWCDQYVAATGAGYMLGVEVWYAGRLWRRTQGYGPEGPARTSGWQDATPGAT